MPEVNPLALALPMFGGAILVEHWLLRRRGRRDAYHFGTAVADIACGASYQALELILRLVALATYWFVYEHASLIRWEPGSVWPWVIGVLGVDLGYYVWHRVSHVVNAMWAVHAVHHHSEDYNLAVALRQPLIEPLTWTPFFCVFAVVGVPADVALISFGLNLFYQFWLHTELVDKLPWVFEWVLNTPSHHRVHHGIEPEYLDKNFGGMFVFWDRMFGTFEPERRRPTYGTTTPLRSFNPLWANVEHFVRIGELAARATTCRQKLYAFVAHPTWRPDGVEGKRGARQSRFRPSVSRGAVRRAALLLGVISAGLFLLLAFEARLGVAAQALAFGVVTAGLVGVTGLLERQAWAGRVVLAAGLGAVVFAARLVV